MNIKCCNCGSDDIMFVEYGTADESMIKRIENGEVLHGGCAINGLMQKYYCMECDSRFDDECTDLFIDHIRRIEFKQKDDVIEIIFKKDKLEVKTKDIDKEIEYTSDLKKSLKETQVEFYQSISPSEYQIRIECYGYIQDIVEKSGNESEPVNAVFFLNWINECLKK